MARADITAFNVVTVAVAVIARMHPTFSLSRSIDALSLMNEGRKLCDLFYPRNTHATLNFSWKTEDQLNMILISVNSEITNKPKPKETKGGASTHHSDTQ